MTLVALHFVDHDAALAQRLRADLIAAGHAVAETPSDQAHAILVVILSPRALEDLPFQQAVVEALERHQHILPVLAAPTPLPQLINHLQALDFSKAVQPERLLAQVERLSAPDAPRVMTVLTPGRRAANRRVGLLLGIMMLGIFAVSIWGVASGIVRAPENEFASVETQVILTRAYYIDNALPRSSEDALNFAATITANPTRSRVQLIATATAIAGGVDGTFIPRSTSEATAFPLTLEAVSTLIQERLIATVTAAAGGNPQ